MRKPPTFYEGAAEQAEKAGRWREAAQLWEDAYGASIGHGRRQRYDERGKAAHVQAAAQWNQTVPVGTAVLYWPGVRAGEGRPSVTRSAAWILPSGSAMVMVDGYAGGICLTHVEPCCVECGGIEGQHDGECRSRGVTAEAATVEREGGHG